MVRSAMYWRFPKRAMTSSMELNMRAGSSGGRCAMRGTLTHGVCHDNEAHLTATCAAGSLRSAGRKLVHDRLAGRLRRLDRLASDVAQGLQLLGGDPRPPPEQRHGGLQVLARPPETADGPA